MLHHLLEDGEGILAITLGTQSTTLAPEGASERGDASVSETATAVALVQRFHLAAMRALADESSIGRAPPGVYRFNDWACRTLSWMPRHVQPPTRNAICGYRIIMAEEAPSRVDRVSEAQKQVAITIYNFTPAHVNRAVAFTYGLPRVSDLPSRLSNCSCIPLAEEDAATDNPAERYLVKDSFPSFVAPQLVNELPKYVTGWGYIAASRTIIIGRAVGPSVLHFTHQYLCFVQVSAIEEIAGLWLMTCAVKISQQDQG